jgi:DNA repair photolyase
MSSLWLGAVQVSEAWLELDRRDRGTRFIAIEPKSVINGSAATKMPFWSVNPYIGCEFGCAYCYARDTHRWTVERAASAPAAPDAAREALTMPSHDAFERRILVKRNAAALLVRTLRPARLRGDPLVIGTATDPYQPGERRFRVTRALLEALLGYRGLRLGIITKSPLITRDLALLVRLASRHTLTINMSLGAIDAKLLRKLEPRTPTPAARLRAMQKLAGAGLRVGLMIAPILPGITDGCPALRALIEAAKAAGAAWVAGVPLRMGPATRRTLLPWLLRERPDLEVRYRRHYGEGQAVSRAYARGLDHRLQSLQAEAGMEPRDGMRRQRELAAARRRDDVQLLLWNSVNRTK